MKKIKFFRRKSTKNAHYFTTRDHNEPIEHHLKQPYQGSLWVMKSEFEGKDIREFEITITLKEKENVD